MPVACATGASGRYTVSGKLGERLLKTDFSALKNGYVDACAGHETAYRDYIKNTEGSYRILDEALLTANLGVAFEKHTDREKAEKLSAVLEEMRADGTIRKILEQYDLDVDFALNGGDVQ